MSDQEGSTASSRATTEIERLLKEFEAAITAFPFNAYDDVRTHTAIVRYVEKLETEIKARGDIYGRMCETLHECCQKYHLGLGGEHVDRLAVEEVGRLRATVQQ